MKRIYLAVIFAVIIAVIAGSELGFVCAKADYYIDMIESADNYIMKNDFEKAIDVCSKIEKSWKSSEKKFDILLIHDYVDKVSNGILQMKVHAENASVDMYYSASITTKRELAAIKGSEYPTCENIL